MKNLKLKEWKKKADFRSLKDLQAKEKLKFFLLSFLLVLFILASLFSASLLGILKETPSTNTKNLSSSYYQTSSIYDEDGQVLENIESEEFRTIIPLKEMPDHLQKAFISIEDKRFYKHKGIDPRGILSSLRDNIQSGAMVRGGSTITQQLARNVYLSQEKSLDRKLKEAYLSLRLEDDLSKDKILEAYLNRINLGQGAYGVQGAAQTYFSKDAKDLTLAQAALLAGIVKSPRDYSPILRLPADKSLEEKSIGSQVVGGEEYTLYLNPKSLDRQKIVLKEMLSQGYISKNDYALALKEDVYASIQPVEKKHHTMSSYALDFIKAQASEAIAQAYKISLDEAEHKLFTGGYKIQTSLDLDLQKDLEALHSHFVENYLLNTSAQAGARMLRLNKQEDGHIVDDQGSYLFLRRNSLLDGEGRISLNTKECQLSNQGLLLSKKYFNILGKDIYFKPLYEVNDQSVLLTYDYGQWQLDGEAEERKDGLLIPQSFLRAHPDFFLEDQGSLHFNPAYYTGAPKASIQPQTSSIVIDNHTGLVRAIIGGLDLDGRGSKIFNRAVMSSRCPGTALTPLSVYLTALENGKKPSAIYDDALFSYQGNFWPENPSGKYYGLETLRKNLEHGSRTVPAKIVEELGFDAVLKTYSKLGIYQEKNPEKDQILSPKESKKHDFTLDSMSQGHLRLGLTNYDLASFYYALSQGGSYQKPSIITKIEDQNGLIIYRSKYREKRSLTSPKNAAILTDFLRTNSLAGEASKLNLEKADLAAILGENKFGADQWVFGYSPDFTIGSWLGCDLQKVPLEGKEGLLIDLWNQVAKDAHRNLEKRSHFSLPKGLETIRISEKSGLLASSESDRAGASYEEIFPSGTGPKDYEDGFKTYKVCRQSGKRITKYCPYDTIILKSFYQRKDPYKGKTRPPILPMDLYSIEDDYCPIHTKEWAEDQEDLEKENQGDKNNED